MSALCLMVAGTRSGVGKTTVASALVALLAEAGFKVRPFKLGPDYIDSGRHALLAGEPCLNLDRFLCVPPGREADSADLLRSRFLEGLRGCDAAVVEAVGGFHDDWHGDGNSPAAIAKILGLPVLLVCDGQAACQTAGIAAGAVALADPGVALAGLVFPLVSGEEHLERIRRGLPAALRDGLVLRLPRAAALDVEERHLGLVTAAEGGLDRAAIAAAARPHLPLDRILAAAARVEAPEPIQRPAADGAATHASAPPRARAPAVRGGHGGGGGDDATFVVAVARDEAFSFYYPDNLAALESLGARLAYFSPIRDRALPPCDFALFGGGFPELYGEALESNGTMRDSIRAAALAGLPIYAECGGFMYLASSFEEPSGASRRGVGLFPFEIGFGPLVLSYAEVDILEDCHLGHRGEKARAHVFHRSFIRSGEAETSLLRLTRPGGRSFLEGFRSGSALGGWAHLHFAGSPGAAPAIAGAATAFRSARRAGEKG